MNDLFKKLLITVIFIIFIATGTLSPIEKFLRTTLSSLRTGLTPTTQASVNESKLLQDGEILKLEAENEDLRKALDVTESTESVVTARVTAHSPHLSTNRITIQQGSAAGIQRGQVVLHNGIVVGIVDQVSKNETIILLLDDQNFRLEVSFGGNRGVLKGAINGSIIDRVLPDVEAKAGELVVTAGSRLVPENLVVGRVVGQLVTPEKVFQQLHFASPIDLDRLNYVQVVVSK